MCVNWAPRCYGKVSPSDSTRMFSPPGSSRMASPQGSMRIASPQDSTRMFRPAGSKVITIHNLDVAGE